MIEVATPAQLPPDFGDTVVTVGKFDGIHLGHQKLIQGVTESAAHHQLKSVVLTFDRHPDALLNPAECKLPLIGSDQKAALIAAHQINALVTLEFTQELATLSPEDFVQQILVDGLKAKVIYVGEDFRFGFRGAGDVSLLAELGQHNGFDVRVVPSVTVEGHKISTTTIRDALDRGDVRLAAAMLGRNHSTFGEIEHGLIHSFRQVRARCCEER